MIWAECKIVVMNAECVMRHLLLLEQEKNTAGYCSYSLDPFNVCVNSHQKVLRVNPSPDLHTCKHSVKAEQLAWAAKLFPWSQELAYITPSCKGDRRGDSCNTMWICVTERYNLYFAHRAKKDIKAEKNLWNHEIETRVMKLHDRWWGKGIRLRWAEPNPDQRPLSQQVKQHSHP